MKRIHLPIVTSLLLGLFLSACVKEKVEPTALKQMPLSPATDELIIENMMQELYFELDEMDLWLMGFKSGNEGPNCRTITIEPEGKENWPKTMTIDYGEGCEIKEGLVKRGKLIIEVSGPRGSEQLEKTVRFVRYAVNGKVFQGGKKLTFTQEGRRGHPTWTVNSRVKIHLDRETTIERNSSKTRIMFSGYDTPKRLMDDQFMMVGTTSGVNREGKSYKTEITEPLLNSRSCDWIRKGIISFSVLDESKLELNFGDGECDNLATVTKDGETREIKLKRK